MLAFFLPKRRICVSCSLWYLLPELCPLLTNKSTAFLLTTMSKQNESTEETLTSQLEQLHVSDQAISNLSNYQYFMTESKLQEPIFLHIQKLASALKKVTAHDTHRKASMRVHADAAPSLMPDILLRRQLKNESYIATMMKIKKGDAHFTEQSWPTLQLSNISLEDRTTMDALRVGSFDQSKKCAVHQSDPATEWQPGLSLVWCLLIHIQKCQRCA